MSQYLRSGPGGDGESLEYDGLTYEQEITASVASTTFTAAIPADFAPLFVRVRVKEALTGVGCTGYAVGTAGDPNLWGDVTGTAAGTKNDPGDQTAANPRAATTATDLIVTYAGANATGGKLIMTVHGYRIPQYGS